MAVTVETLTARLESLDKAIDSGVLLVRHGDTSTTYRSIAEMTDARERLQHRINVLSTSGVTRYRSLRLHGKSGY